MMRNSLWLFALLLVVSTARLAHAGSTENVTFNYNGGSITGTETLSNGQVTTLTIDGVTLDAFGGDNSLLLGCETSKCSWDLFALGGSIDLTVSNGSGGLESAGCIHCTRLYGYLSGGTYGPPSTAAMPEPPVYLLALLGVFFTRNRISQGIRQTLRWNS